MGKTLKWGRRWGEREDLQARAAGRNRLGGVSTSGLTILRNFSESEVQVLS